MTAAIGNLITMLKAMIGSRNRLNGRISIHGGESTVREQLVRCGGISAHTTRRALIVVSLVATSVWAFPVFAGDEHDVHDEGAEVTDHTEGRDHEFKNGLALFLGVTHEPGHDDEATWGLEYGRRLSPRWVVGGLFDYAGGGQRNYIIAPFVAWKPFGGGFTLLAAPGIEYHNGRGEVEHHYLKSKDSEVDEDETHFLLRLGATYWFHVGSRYGIGPTVDLDLVDGEQVWVYGVNFEVMF